MTIESKYVWMDGKMVPFEDANVHMLSHTLHYGLGAFEGIRSYRQHDGGGGIFKLDEHLHRLFDSAKMCRMKMPFDFETVRQACIDTLKANEFEEAYIRPIVFLGHGAMGLGTRHNPVRVAVATWKWGAYLGDEGIRNGIRCGTSSYTRHHINANLQRAKIIGHYVNSILARYEANDNGYDEAIISIVIGLITRPMTMDMMRRSCLITVDMLQKGLVKTFSLSKMDWSKHPP